jgi:hypothetical protein
MAIIMVFEIIFSPKKVEKRVFSQKMEKTH